MSSPDPRAVCISLHDVAPATWPACRQLLRFLDELQAGPVTLLVVPDYHRRGGLEADSAFCRALDGRLARGDELALHGYFHLDDAPPPRSPAAWARRRLLTAAEGEFAALSATEARRRLRQGSELFRRLRWPLAGFVAPAWQLGPAARAALSEFPLAYTTTREALWRLPDWRPVRSPSLVYSVRAYWRRKMSVWWNEALLRRLAAAPLLRLSLHPADAAYPEVLAHWRSLIERALGDRQPYTKAGWLARQP